MRSLISQIKCALADGRQRYKLAAELITKLMATKNLNQKQVAEKIGQSPSTVCRILQWYKDGCQADSVFGPEIAARRIATSQSGRETGLVFDEHGRLVRDGDYVQESIELVAGEVAEGVSDERYAVLCVLQLQGAAEKFTRLARGQTFGRKVPRPVLEALARKLTASVAAGEVALGEVQAALREIPRALNDNNETVGRRRRPHAA